MDSNARKTVWRWIRGLTAVGLLLAIFGLAIAIHSMAEPPLELIATLSFLIAALLFWLFCLPPWQTFDRYTLAWIAIMIMLVIGGVAVLINP